VGLFFQNFAPVVPGNLYLLKYLTFSFYPVSLDPCYLADQ
jgi:hypothetical protein